MKAMRKKLDTEIALLSDSCIDIVIFNRSFGHDPDFHSLFKSEDNQKQPNRKYE